MKMGLFNKNPYIWAGSTLLIAGSLVSPSAYFLLHLTWLTALGICMLILSFIFLALGRTIPKLSPEVCRLLLETGITNITSLIEELSIRNKAIYLPSSLTNNQPQALIPLHSTLSLPKINKALPQRLIVRYGDNPNDIGLLLSTVGSTAISMLESKPGPTSNELETALTSLFSGILNAADRIKVTRHENQIQVAIHNPRIESKNTWSHHCLGSPLASMVASIAAEAWGKPVIIKQEYVEERKHLVELEVEGEDIQ